MLGFLVRDDQGAVTVDWVVLTAGIIVLGIVVVYSVMSNSHAYLDEKFDILNENFANQGTDLAKVERSVTIKQ